MLRSGFENALDAVRHWQEEERKRNGGTLPPGMQIIPLDEIAPPFVYDGFWSDYQDGEATFKEEWARFTGRERQFFDYLWRLRASVLGTFVWFVRQQVHLLGTVVRENRIPEVLFIYLPLQFIGLAALVLALFRYRRLYREFLVDVRMYIAPRGVVERAIVDRIDFRVGSAFMQMIGLDLDFRPLLPCDRIEAAGERITFNRVVWVAHSLGTVISYNVLSRLFECAAKLEESGDDEQKAGVLRFRETLRRFVTLGSPLNKISLLFPGKDGPLRPWPTDRRRRAFLVGGDKATNDQDAAESEWWINFYHVLDPVSGPIKNPTLCGGELPANYHVKSKLAWIVDVILPGWAHVEYWKDLKTLRYILGRTYGAQYLYDQKYVPWPPWIKRLLAMAGLVVWATLLCGGCVALILWLLVRLGVFSWADLVATVVPHSW